MRYLRKLKNIKNIYLHHWLEQAQSPSTQDEPTLEKPSQDNKAKKIQTNMDLKQSDKRKSTRQHNIHDQTLKTIPPFSVSRSKSNSP